MLFGAACVRFLICDRSNSPHIVVVIWAQGICVRFSFFIGALVLDLVSGQPWNPDRAKIKPLKVFRSRGGFVRTCSETATRDPPGNPDRAKIKHLRVFRSRRWICKNTFPNSGA